MNKKYEQLQKGLLRRGLTKSCTLGRHVGIMDEAADAIGYLETHISRFAEFHFILVYVSENCFDEEICRDRLRMLWTAYCLHHGLEADTSGYDTDLLELWNKLTETDDGASDWSDFDSFDNFMCTYLV